MSVRNVATVYSDHRVSVILIFFLSVLVTHTFSKSKDSTSIDHGVTAMTLYQQGYALKLENYTESDSLPIEKNIRSEFTPFFFAPVKINSASKELLMTLPGIGSGMSNRIIEYRGVHGGIHSGVQFMQIRGIGEKRYASLRDHISFE
ncbi:ComEA family DNA-binding protein [Desulfosediminicola flagellatus]|uniref:ComEA family DNA-binding protein n=1 Tax=Desulfosediminicola flagellatus TaxID=2569541 RepID=UPI0010AB5B27|nr:helix-hairpin-helix domain-containing protein [Desulfosediminicola flagellatus]